MAVWLVYALLGAVCASMVSIFTKLGITNISPALATAIKAIIMAVFLVGVAFFKGDFNNFATVTTHKKDLFFIVLTGVFGALSWLFMTFAFKHGKVTQVVPIDKMSIVITIVLSIFIFKENLSFKGYIGVIMIAIGGILVALK